MISFKFSLILVSYFFNSPRLRGDYSAMNWKQFNRFSLAFCIFPYACMMASCIYFIMTDGFWSYPGFVASEVVFLSSIIQMLLAVDAISAIKCKTVGKRKTIEKINLFIRMSKVVLWISYSETKFCQPQAAKCEQKPIKDQN